ncbi:11513_t:CDS:2 [Acaulospora colombiana]|uniref:11513_t:CDS:1 n=1 Tax=Acaulospora colombiana TaxID=27376 RepID=A0ACA9L856_9GLOM|nr:11513_t:CDS:2 [Acaulospora colombiana]
MSSKRARSTSVNFTKQLDDGSERTNDGKVAGEGTKKQKLVTSSARKLSAADGSTEPPTKRGSSCINEKGTSVRNCLMWFRTDLRVKDNVALYRASSLVATATGTPQGNYLFALFIISPEEWKSHDISPARVDFWIRNLRELRKKLLELNIPLIVQIVENAKNVASTVIEWCQRLNVSHVFANKEYEVDEMRRDNRLLNTAIVNSIKVEFLHSQCVVEPGLLLTKVGKNKGKTYTVYTPFKNSWIKFVGSNISLLDLVPDPFANSSEILDSHPETFKFDIPELIPKFSLDTIPTRAQENFPAGESEVHRRLEQFISDRIDKYHEARDIPSQDGTSSLSPYIASGIISTRQCVLEAYLANSRKLSGGKIGVVKWIEEIVWREFYRHVLVGFPHVCKNQPFKLHMNNIEWNDDEEHFQRWCQGKTGYPIVDAGKTTNPSALQFSWERIHNLRI